MIVKQKKMDKRINYKLNLDTIFASASSIGMSAIKTVRISGGEAKKIFKILTKKNYQRQDIPIYLIYMILKILL